MVRSQIEAKHDFVVIAGRYNIMLSLRVMGDFLFFLVALQGRFLFCCRAPES